MKIDLVSPHSPITAAGRLKKAVGATLTADTPKCVTGNGTEHEMVLWVHRPRVRNDFKTMLRATMEPYQGGTRIRGRIGAPISAGLFMGCWFSFVLIFLLVGLVLALAAAPGDWSFHLPFILVPSLMLVGGGFMVWIGRRSGREDRDAILTFLRETIGTYDRHGRRL